MNEKSNDDVEGDKTPKDLMVEKLLSPEDLELKQPTGTLIHAVAPRTITGVTNQLSFNRGSVDWGYHGMLAFGSNCSVVAVDTVNIQPVQCLNKHKGIVNKVLWAPKTDNHDRVTLISSDIGGQIIYWDVKGASVITALQDGNKPVLGMEWIPGLEDGQLHLATLHSPYYLIIWDLMKHSKIWKKGFTDTLISFNFNPFDSTKLAFLCPDCILFVDDFNPNKIPSTNGTKFYISSPRLSDGPEDSVRTRDRLKRLMKGLVVAETKPRPEDAMTVSECLQLIYHRSQRDHILLLYPRDILIVDLHINQTVGIISIEKAMSPLVQIISARQRDVIYCLHESGSVSVRVRRKGGHVPYIASPLDAPAESLSSLDITTYNADMCVFICSYEHRCQSEVIRQMKGSRVLGLTCNPISEKNLGLLLSSGKLVFLELERVGGGTEVSLNQLFGPSTDEMTVIPQLRLLLEGLLSSVSSPLSVIRMCPPMTTKNRQHYLPLMAAGTNTGIIQVYNMARGTVDKEFAIHSYPVRGIEWTSLSSFITYAYSSTNTVVRNEVLLTDVSTGQSIPLRKDHGEENPIEIVRVSPLRQYFVVVMKDGPFELWDLKNLTLLRTMPKKFPFVTALEWSPIHSVKSLKTKKKPLAEEPIPVVMSPVGEQAPVISSSSASQNVEQIVAREHFVFSDTESQLYHFSVEGSVVKDGIKIPPESGVGMVTSIAFKSNQIIQGDVDGSLNIWDLKGRSSCNISTARGWIRKMKFAPAKGNLKLLVLFTDGVDVVDLKQHQYERIAQLKCPRDMVKIIDIDWATQDTVVLATEDGCIRIMDIKLTTCSSPVEEYTFEDPVCCPAFLPSKIASHVQLLLSTQFWKDFPNYSNFSVSDGFSPADVHVINEQLAMMNTDMLSNSTLKTAERCLLASHLMGDQKSIDFWTVALYYLKVSAADATRREYSSGETKTNMLFHMESTSPPDLKRVNKHPDLEPLDTCYDTLCDPYSYQRHQLERVGVYEWRRGDYQHTQKVVERLILLGEMDKAVQLLLETDLDNSNYYTDAIKACLIATIQSTGAAQSTIKLVATNLIANGKIWEGVQLLCLIGKGLDGCRYLISYGLWDSAVWLGKSILPPNESVEVMRKWAEHLHKTGNKNLEVLLMMSLGLFERALELLLMEGQDDQAGLLLLSYLEYQQLQNTIDKSVIETVASRFSTRLQSILSDVTKDQLENFLIPAS
ncbi:WD repeat-containing protein 11-like [Lycorma delicatula]|uniref:WD repeat-containing protein 11-like n=1 Tax=Lycorma delicatula TaxID=130591 RepID=UPI003F511FEE